MDLEDLDLAAGVRLSEPGAALAHIDDKSSGLPPDAEIERALSACAGNVTQAARDGTGFAHERLYAAVAG